MGVDVHGGCSWGGVGGGLLVVRSLGKLVQREDLKGRDGGGGGRGEGGGGESQDGWFPTVCIAAIPSSSTIFLQFCFCIFSIFCEGIILASY